MKAARARLSWGQDDKEPELGWTEHVDQTLAGKVEEGRWLTYDGEPELGFVGIGTGWRKGEDIKDVGEHVDEREPDGRRGPGAEPEKKLRERVRRLPSGDVMREIKSATVANLPVPPTDSDSMDLRAHYLAAKGF